MRTQRAENIVREVFAFADVEIGGTRPWDIQVHDQRLYRRLLAHGSLGLGESYMDGWWDCEQLEELFYKLVRCDIEKKVQANWRTLLYILGTRVLNLQTRRRSLSVAETHYNLPFDLWEAMLGETLLYTCAYWKTAPALTQAQLDKLDLICRKLCLQSSDRVLDLGSGWGSFAKFAAESYGCTIDSVNISAPQVQFSRDYCKDLPINIHLCDYRQTAIYNPQQQPYDKIVSLGLGEHIGPKNYRSFFELMHTQLKENGLLLMHHVGSSCTRTRCDPWFDKYIFPHGVAPSVRHIADASEEHFVMEDWHNFGADYPKTLLAWFSNFETYRHAQQQALDERFCRMWRYYLLSVAGDFRTRRSLQLHQIVLSKNGFPSYASVR